MRQLGKGEFRPELSPAAKAAAERDKEMWKAIALSIGEWLIANGRMSRPIHRLELWELQGIAWAAICQWSEWRQAEAQRLGRSSLSLDPAEDIARLTP